MDGYTLTAQLRKARRQHHISAASQGLFHELIAISNEEGWPKSFQCSNAELQAAMGCSEKTLDSIRKQLVLAGILDYESGKTKRVVGVYGFKTVVKITTKKNTQSTTEANTEQNTKATDLYKEKDKLKEKVVVSEEERAAIFEKYCEEENKKLEDHLAGRDDFEEKEKSSAQKEKSWPLWPDVLQNVKTCSLYENAKRLLPNRDDDIRESEFEWFWEQKRDEYLARHEMPAFTEIAKHFYYWLDKKITYNRSKKITPNQNGAHKTGSTNRLAIATNWEAKP